MLRMDKLGAEYSATLRFFLELVFIEFTIYIQIFISDFDRERKWLNTRERFSKRLIHASQIG